MSAIFRAFLPSFFGVNAIYLGNIVCPTCTSGSPHNTQTVKMFPAILCAAEATFPIALACKIRTTYNDKIEKLRNVMGAKNFITGAHISFVGIIDIGGDIICVDGAGGGM